MTPGLPPRLCCRARGGGSPALPKPSCCRVPISRGSSLRFDLMLVAASRLPRHWQGAWRRRQLSAGRTAASFIAGNACAKHLEAALPFGNNDGGEMLAGALAMSRLRSGPFSSSSRLVAADRARGAARWRSSAASPRPGEQATPRTRSAASPAPPTISRSRPTFRMPGSR